MSENKKKEKTVIMELNKIMFIILFILTLYLMMKVLKNGSYLQLNMAMKFLLVPFKKIMYLVHNFTRKKADMLV